MRINEMMLKIEPMKKNPMVKIPIALQTIATSECLLRNDEIAPSMVTIERMIRMIEHQVRSVCGSVTVTV